MYSAHALPRCNTGHLQLYPPSERVRGLKFFSEGNAADAFLAIKLVTFTMYFSSPQLLPWHDIWKVWKTKTGSKEAAKTTPKLYPLSSTTEPYKGNIKKVHYRRGISAAFGSTECRCQLADLHRSYRRHDLSFTCRLFVACVARVSAQVCRESWGQEQLSILDKLVRKRLLRRLQTIVLPAWNEKPWVYQCCIWRRTLQQQPDTEPTDYGGPGKGWGIFLSLQPVTLPYTTPHASDSHAQLIRCFSSSKSSFQVQGQRL